MNTLDVSVIIISRNKSKERKGSMKGLDIMYKYFGKCSTIEDVKNTYRTLCKKFHPDIHGIETEAVMKEINAEYELAFNHFKNIYKSKVNDNTTYTKETTETPEAFKNIINSLINCEGLEINIVGAWIWLTGCTYPYKDIIKELGFRWASNKKAWYWRAEEDAVVNHRKMSLDEIKNKYGCEVVHTYSRKTLATA